MKNAVAEITRISQGLPPRKAAQLLKVAQVLQQQTRRSEPINAVNGDTEWERIINDPGKRPKLEALRKRLAQLERDGKLEDFDFGKL
jgi:hypothetical protein